MSADQVMPTRRGEEPAAPHQVQRSATLTLGLLAILGLTSLLVPNFVFFAVGAGAGYSLSGSV